MLIIGAVPELFDRTLLFLIPFAPLYIHGNTPAVDGCYSEIYNCCRGPLWGLERNLCRHRGRVGAELSEESVREDMQTLTWLYGRNRLCYATPNYVNVNSVSYISFENTSI